MQKALKVANYELFRFYNFKFQIPSPESIPDNLGVNHNCFKLTQRNWLNAFLSLKLRSFGKMVISQNYFNGRECQDFWPFLFFSIYAPAKVKISQFPSSKERKQDKAHEKLFQDFHNFIFQYARRKKIR